MQAGRAWGMAGVASRPWPPWGPPSPRPSGVSRAFSRAALSKPRVLCPSSQARVPGPGSMVSLSVAPGSTRSNPASAIGTLIFCPRHFVGLLAPDPGRFGLRRGPCDLGQSRRAPWKRRREPCQEPVLPSPPTGPTRLCCPHPARAPQSHAAFRSPGRLLAGSAPGTALGLAGSGAGPEERPTVDAG